MKKRKKSPRQVMHKQLHGKLPEAWRDQLIYRMLHGVRGVDWDASPDVIPYDWRERMIEAVPCPCCDPARNGEPDRTE